MSNEVKATAAAPQAKTPKAAKKTKKAEAKRIVVTLTKSTIAGTQEQIANVAALGLKRIRDSKVHYDTPIIRGMINKVTHLVSVQDYTGEDA